MLLSLTLNKCHLLLLIWTCVRFLLYLAEWKYTGSTDFTLPKWIRHSLFYNKALRKNLHTVESASQLKQNSNVHAFEKSLLTVVMCCTIWYHLYIFKNVKKTHRGVLHIVKLQVEACNFTKSNTPPWVFFIIFKLYKLVPNCVTHYSCSVEKLSAIFLKIQKQTPGMESLF